MVWGAQEVAPRRLFTAVAPSLLLGAPTGAPRSTSAGTARAPSPAPPNDQYMYHCWLISPSPSRVGPGSQSQATRGSTKQQSAIPSFTPQHLSSGRRSCAVGSTRYAAKNAPGAASRAPPAVSTTCPASAASICNEAPRSLAAPVHRHRTPSPYAMILRSCVCVRV